MRVNLKQLSEIVGLSQTTVSRALNGYPEVSEKTREKVLKAATQHGYQPNRTAQSLATGKARVVGFVMKTDSTSPVDPHFMQYLGGIGEVALRRGYDLQICPTTDEEEINTYRRVSDSGQVDAFILSSPLLDDPRIEALHSLNLPFIVHGRSEYEKSSYAFLDIDNEAAFYDASQHLLDLGHQRIAIINGPAHLTFAYHRRKGAEKALAKRCLTIAPQHIFHGDMTERTGYDQAKTMLENAQRPTAILCASMLVALGTVRAASDLGLEIGRDLSIIAHDDVFPYVSPENFRTPLTTTHSPIRDAGSRIMERLADAIEHGRTPARAEILPVSLVTRASTGAVSI